MGKTGMEDINFEEGLDDITLDFEDSSLLGSGDNFDNCVSYVESGVENEEGIGIEGVDDFGFVDWKNLYSEEVLKYHFPDRVVAFKFYNCYGRVKGFSGRKSRVVRNKLGEIVQQTFVCHKHGFRDGKYGSRRKRVREAKADTRCGCEARMKVGVKGESKRWQVLVFYDEHNHELYEDMFKGMLAGHREMHNDDIIQMNNMRAVGIRTPSIISSFAYQSGGFPNLNFIRQDVYNQIQRQRRMMQNDATAALEYLRKVAVDDVDLFCCHTEDEEGRLQHLFWCDGISRADYQIFGDVLAFDATYGKNKYYCPVVVFSGVNHHRQTTIFGFGIVADETEDTYVWLLEQFLLSMNGKTPISVITDGDKAMKKAISRVFPEANHRLCSWHLLKNATSNVKKAKFTKAFKKCMYADLEIVEFRLMWDSMVKKYGVENHKWVVDMFEKREMWCTAYIRGRFFGGLRTTSRCEGFHSLMKKYVSSRYNLHDFVHHLIRCLNEMRFRELQTDFFSAHGEPVLETNYPSLERFASSVYTRVMFKHFRTMIVRGSNMHIVGVRRSVCRNIYMVSKLPDNSKRWLVSFDETTHDMSCSCMLMESFGMPCEHIVRVLIYLKIDELPKSLVLDRWTKRARVLVHSQLGNGFKNLDSCTMVRKAALLDFCRKMCDLASRNNVDFVETRGMIRKHIEHLQHEHSHEEEYMGSVNVACVVKDPICVRSKGRGQTITSLNGRSKRVTRCGLCKGIGHNRKTCDVHNVNDEDTGNEENRYTNLEVDEEPVFYNEELNEDMFEHFSNAETNDDLFEEWEA